MAAYRLYCLDGAGHISFAEWIEADDDEEAIAQARKLKNGMQRCEVSHATRMVGSLSAHDLMPKQPISSLSCSNVCNR